MESEKTPENVMRNRMEAAGAENNENTLNDVENCSAGTAGTDREAARRFVYRETMSIAIGVAAGTALMCAVFALLGRFDTSVLLGGVIGAVMAVANFFFMAVSASLAADKAEGQDVKGGAALMKSSYALRLFVMFVILFACVKSGLCNAIAAILPLVFVRPVITITEFFRKSGEA